MSSSRTCAQLFVCLLVAIDLNADLPEPPSQHAAWNPPSSVAVPDYVVNVSVTLFAAGLADPRGGSYREVELPVFIGDEKTLKTHAWVFPDGYAVAWNGLVYRVQTVGPPADLGSDVRTMVSAHRWGSRMLMRPMDDHDPQEAAFWYGLSGHTLAPTSISLLLRLRRSDLAAELWKAPEGGAAGCFGCAQRHETDEASWLVTAAQVWFGTAYSRLVGAFSRGDYQGAVEVAESLLEWQSRVPDTWRKRKNRFPLRVPDISFLAPVPALLADSERRLEEPARPPLELQAGPAADAQSAHPPSQSQAARIADLIERLEDVEGAKAGFPGPLIYSFDPVYAALKNEGEAAVDSLLDAYEFDKRLTRTFDFGRPWNIDRTPIPVHDIVEILLGDILGDARIRNSRPAELRAWWAQQKSNNRSERSFEILADDQAKPEQWLEAADFLTTRSDVQWSEGGKLSAAGACDPTKAAPDVNGEELRARKDPSVNELIAKRTASLVASGSELACSMSVRAALWDGRAAIPVLQQAATLKSCRASELIAIARLSLGVPGAAAGWALELADRPKSRPLRIDELSPLWMFPADPTLQQAAEQLFAAPASSWSPMLKWDQVHSPLLAIPIFRQAVLAALEDSSVVGKASRTQDRRLSFSTANGGGESSTPDNDPRQAPPGQERPIRVMDLVAWELSNLNGAPAFGLDWPNTEKDAAISAIVQFLRAHENELRAFPMQLQDTNCPGQRVYLSR